MNIRHGTRGGYYDQGCRCRPCKDAAADYQMQRRLIRVERPIPDHVHGQNGYVNYCCRCQICRVGHTDYMRAWHLKRAEA